MHSGKVTTMVLKVDLQCSSCYKKIKKILCKFPQIRDQIYEEKQNTVTIVVVCCSPEKVRDKLCCEGGKTIKSIEIKEPPKPKTPEKPKPKPNPPADKPPAPAPASTPAPAPTQTPAPAPTPTLAPAPAPAPPAFVPVCYPPMYPVGIRCGQCDEGHTDGPCYHGHGRPVPSYDNYGYGPSSFGGDRDCYTSRCDYFSEENTSGCRVMKIRDQIYDEKQNTVTIVVVCSSPEKVRDKLCCKGGKTIKSIEIKEPPKPKPPEKPKPKPNPPADKPPASTPAPAPTQTPAPAPTTTLAPAPAPAPPAFVPVCYPPMYPVGIRCGQCYEGHTDGPCYHGHGRPVPSYDNYGYGPSSFGGDRDCYTSRCDYFSEENTSGCRVM
ncbi:unnamed protein product [Camellia sinensis]